MTKDRSTIFFPRVHRVSRQLVDGCRRLHYYHRKTRDRLPDPKSPEFVAAYLAAERKWTTNLESNGGDREPEQLQLF